MNSRERILTALRHKEPDKVPFDLGATVATKISHVAYTNLRNRLRLPKKTVEIGDIIQQMAVIDNNVIDYFGVDAREVGPRSSFTEDRLEIKDAPGYTYFYDEWGIGWRMPKSGGFYYDMFEHPLCNLASVEEIAHYSWPDPVAPARFVGLVDQARAIHEKEQRAVVLGGLTAGVSEMAAFMMGFERYYVALKLAPTLVSALMDRILELKMCYWERALAICGQHVDIVCEADDLAGQNGLLISPELYRELIKPRHKELFSHIKRQAPVYIWFHSCGAVRPLIPDLIEVGVDILNPVQVSAVGMDTGELKREFGEDLAFWGGGVDTQQILSRGTQEEVRHEVRRRIFDLMPGGGWVFATVHNIQANVPAENILAMWETLQEYGVY